jgi:micrococcal nuclease
MSIKRRFGDMKRLIFLLFLITAPVKADTFTARVIGVTDGDTIKVLVNQHPIKIRLHGIDAPERSQSFGHVSTEHLKKILCNPVTVDASTTDRYGRTIAVLRCAERDLNAQMVTDGYAWAYRRYSLDYVTQEEAARATGRGLWRDNNAIPPWQYRHMTR